MPGIQIIQTSLFLKKQKTLIIADLHLGIEESLTKQGILIPKTNLQNTQNKLKKILNQTNNLNKIIINGDLKHEFGKKTIQEQNETKKILDLLSTKTKETIIIKGNHDTIQNYSKQALTTNEYFFPTEKILILHGHKLSQSQEYKKAKTLIIAHEHPTITLTDKLKKETYKCFLKGKYNQKNLIVMPSFLSNPLGSNILNQKPLSPFLQNQNITEFQTWILADKPYCFGKIKNIPNISNIPT